MSTIKEILEPVLEDHVLLEFDYAQLEIRVLALATGSKQLIDDINSGMDMHTHFASKIFDIPESEVDPAQRKMAKGFSGSRLEPLSMMTQTLTEHRQTWMG